MKIEQNEKERRRWERLPIRVPMFVHWTDSRDRKIQEFATALNIGAGGVLLAMYRGAPLGTNLRIEIPSPVIASEIPLTGSVNQFTAEVVRVEKQDRTHFVAVSFAAPVGRSAAAATLSN